MGEWGKRGHGDMERAMKKPGVYIPIPYSLFPIPYSLVRSAIVLNTDRIAISAFVFRFIQCSIRKINQSDQMRVLSWRYTSNP